MRRILFPLTVGLTLVPALVRADEIQYAAGTGDVVRVRQLLAANPELAKGRPAASPPLVLAAKGGHDEVILVLLAHGADIDEPAPGGNTALQLAVRGEHRRTAGLLLSRGANVNAVEMHGWTALHFAAADGDARTVELLLCYGANVNVKASAGTPLRLAVFNERARIAEMLRHAGAKE
jgi:ankyrin repeat protein